MRLKGEDVADGLRDWVKSELKEGPRQGYHLGKFFFSVSAGTIGALIGIEKLNQTPQMDNLMLWALGLLFISILVALLLALPKKYSVGGKTDLLKEYQKQIDTAVKYVWIWFSLWILGTIIGGFAIRN